MCNRLSEWSPSDSAIEIIKLNGISDKQIKKIAGLFKAAEWSG